MIGDSKIGFGAAYYHEYRLQPRLGVDLDLMAAGGFNLIRVGESVWSTWEPKETPLQPIAPCARRRTNAWSHSWSEMGSSRVAVGL